VSCDFGFRRRMDVRGDWNFQLRADRGEDLAAFLDADAAIRTD
jgi:hypothetical protein